MASSDEEAEIVSDSVTNYKFLTSSNAAVSFSNLPLQWSDQENVKKNRDSSAVFLLGTTVGGLEQIYKEVIAWKLELSYVMPEVYVLSKAKMWIKLQKPRKSYEDVVRSVWIMIHCLYFMKRNVEANRERVLSYLMRALSLYEVAEPLENYLSAHLQLIRSAMTKDKDLAKSKYLETFLMGIDNPGRRETTREENQTTNKSKFIVSDDDMENDDEAAGLFDSVCAYCDNGGVVLSCEGRCIRSFHPTIDAGAETYCESLGFADATQYEAIPTFLCNNCKHQKHQCFVCGTLGSSDKSSATEVFPCVSATCGHFYHPQCVAPLLFPHDKTSATQLQSQIAAGESFTCPIHKCHRCNKGENKEIHVLQFAVCSRCPKAYHRKCLPKSIVFNRSADGSLQQRAWDNLLPKRILMYCMNHEIIPSLGTPKRDHISFPCVVRKRNQEGNKIEKVITERRSKAFGNLQESISEKMPKVAERRYNTVRYGDTALEKRKSSATYERDTEKTPKVVERRYNAVGYVDTALEKGKSSTMYEKRSSFKDSISISRNSEQRSTMVRSKSPCRDMHREQPFTSKPVKKMIAIAPSVDTDMKARILKLVKDSTSSFNFEEFVKEERERCSREAYSSRIGLDKTITLGKVEASVKAVRAALKKLEDGGSVEDAKVVCEPDVLNQLIRWKKKLQVFLAPFIHKARYTSFGRHFTKPHKLKEIVNRLHWYVEEGDMIVDFSCGSNDFSCLMNEKLESTGKKCSFKNYDLMTPKNTFNFEKRNWFNVPVEALLDGSRLIMGLNPPFGVQASLANKFIDHALMLKPKLLILIVPKETQRLDEKLSPYDLIWEDEQLLSGKSFYLPGSVNNQDQPLDDWNLVPPPLSLWSRPDWTDKHKLLAEKHNHIEPNKNKPHQVLHKRSERVMDEAPDCYGDFSSILTDVRNISTKPDGSQPQGLNPSTDMADTNSSSPVISSTNSRSVPTRVELDPPCTQPSHSGPYQGSTPPYGPTVDPSPPCTQPSHSGPNPGFVPPYGPTVDPAPHTQPSHSEPYPAFPPPYGPTMDPHPPHTQPYPGLAPPYGSGPGYTYRSPNGFPSNHYTYHPGATSLYGHYGQATYPTPSPSFTNGQPHSTNEPDIWPPGTNHPNHRYG